MTDDGLFDEHDERTFDAAVDEWGIDAQVDMAVEECAELIVELQHVARDRATVDDVVDELADIRIMYEQLAQYFGRDDVEQRVVEKMDRLRERLPRERRVELEAERRDLRVGYADGVDERTRDAPDWIRDYYGGDVPTLLEDPSGPIALEPTPIDFGFDVEPFRRRKSAREIADEIDELLDELDPSRRPIDEWKLPLVGTW